MLEAQRKLVWGMFAITGTLRERVRSLPRPTPPAASKALKVKDSQGRVVIMIAGGPCKLCLGQPPQRGGTQPWDQRLNSKNNCLYPKGANCQVCM